MLTSIPTLPCLAADEVYCMYLNLLLLCRCCIPAVAVLLAVGGITLFFIFKKIFFNSDIKQRRDDLELSLSLAQAVVACNLRQVLFCQTKSSAGLQEPGGGGGGVGHQPPSTLLCGAPSAESSELGLGLLESRSADAPQ